MQGIAQSFATGAQGMGNVYQAQMLRDQLQTYPGLLQAQLAQANAQSGIMQNTLNYAPQTSQAGIGLTNAQAQQAAANAGYINTEAGKNQFLLDHPSLLIPGAGGAIGGIATAQKLLPSVFAMSGPNGTPVTSVASSTGQIMPPSDPNQGGLAQLNQGGIAPPAIFPSNIMSPGQNQAQGMGAPLPMMPPSQNPIQNVAQSGGGQLFGGNPLANQLLQAQFAPMNKAIAQTNWYNARTSGYNQLSPDGKAQMIAQTNAFGYDPATAAGLLSQGYTLQQLGQNKGYTDPANWPMGQPSPTSANRTQTNLRNGALAELNAIQPWLTSSLAPYSQRIGGFSPVQIGQAISGSNPEAQANLIAAKAITPDYNALRAKIMNGQFGIGMAEELQAQAMNNFKVFEGTVPPAVFARAQEIGEEKFNQMVKAANNSIYTSPASQAAQSQNNGASSGSGANTGASMVTVTGSDGRQWSIPAGNLDAALKRGAKQVQ